MSDITNKKFSVDFPKYCDIVVISNLFVLHSIKSYPDLELSLMNIAKNWYAKCNQCTVVPLGLMDDIQQMYDIQVQSNPRIRRLKLLEKMFLFCKLAMSSKVGIVSKLFSQYLNTVNISLGVESLSGNRVDAASVGVEARRTYLIDMMKIPVSDNNKTTKN